MKAELRKNASGETRLWLHVESAEDRAFLESLDGAAVVLAPLVFSGVIPDDDMEEERLDRVSFRPMVLDRAEGGES